MKGCTYGKRDFENLKLDPLTLIDLYLIGSLLQEFSIGYDGFKYSH